MEREREPESNKAEDEDIINFFAPPSLLGDISHLPELCRKEFMKEFHSSLRLVIHYHYHHYLFLILPHFNLCKWTKSSRGWRITQLRPSLLPDTFSADLIRHFPSVNTTPIHRRRRDPNCEFLPPPPFLGEG